jgi:hypothetical protein
MAGCTACACMLTAGDSCRGGGTTPQQGCLLLQVVLDCCAGDNCHLSLGTTGVCQTACAVLHWQLLDTLSAGSATVAVVEKVSLV